MKATSVRAILAAALLWSLGMATSYACTGGGPVQQYQPEFFFADPKFKAVFLATILEPGRLQVMESFKGRARGVVEADYSDPALFMCGTKPFLRGNSVLVVLFAEKVAGLWHLDREDPYVERLRQAKRTGQSNSALLTDAKLPPN